MLTEEIWFEKKYSSQIKRAPWRHDEAGASERFVGSRIEDIWALLPGKTPRRWQRLEVHRSRTAARRLEFRARTPSLSQESCTWTRGGSSRGVDPESWPVDGWAATDVDKWPMSRRVSRTSALLRNTLGAWHNPGRKEAPGMAGEISHQLQKNPCPKHEHLLFQIAHFLVPPDMFFSLQNSQTSAPHNFSFSYFTRLRIHHFRYFLVCPLSFPASLFIFCNCPAKSQPLTNPLACSPCLSSRCWVAGREIPQYHGIVTAKNHFSSQIGCMTLPDQPLIYPYTVLFPTLYNCYFKSEPFRSPASVCLSLTLSGWTSALISQKK